MGCGSSTYHQPHSVSNRQDTGLRRASKSTSSSEDSDRPENNKREEEERNEIKPTVEKENERDTNLEDDTHVDREKSNIGGVEEDEKEPEATGNEGLNESEMEATIEVEKDEKNLVDAKETTDKVENEENKNVETNETHNDLQEDSDKKEETGGIERETTTNEKEISVVETPTKEEDKEEKVPNDESNNEPLPPTHVDCDIEHAVVDEGKAEEEDTLYDDNYTPFDDEDEDVEIEGYVADDRDLRIRIVDFCVNSLEEEKDERPHVEPDELYTDKEFPLEIALVQDNSGVEWKRPKEFLDDPKLFSVGASRYDVGQGSAGTCWFLSTVSVIAEKKEMIDKIVPLNAYNIRDPEIYDGIFHARFYRFGQWEDIFIDDYLPVIYGNVLWGAKGASDKNELWVSLLEKAFARLHGSYDAIYGGQPGDAYLQLTGGIGERLELDKHEDKPVALFRRIKNALNSGAQVTCVVPAEYDEHLGLVGGHAYSLVGVAHANKTRLVRVRNPWGHGEWKGPWSDGSAEWSSVTDSDLKPPKKDDGEFYVCLEDFMKYFSETTICSLTPDFDCDGVSDSLNFMLNTFGEWTADKCGSFSEILSNPRFAFTVTEEGVREDGSVPFVVQIIQHTTKRSSGYTSIRCDVFKIHTDKTKKKGRICAVEIQGKKNNVYTTELQSSFRHKLKPGKYMVIPSTCEGGVHKSFLLRMFTPAPLKNVKEIPIETSILSSDNDESLSHDGKDYSLTFEKIFLGEFISGVNAGGQVSNRDSYHKNPQYVITVPDVGADVPLVIHIMQTQVEPRYPVGFRLFPLDQDVVPPVDVNYLYSKYDSSPSHTEGSQSKFMISWDVDVKFILTAGRYLGLIHLDHPDTEKPFAILFKSNTSINIKGLQTGE